MSSRPRRTGDSSRGFELLQLLPPFAPTHPAARWLFGLARGGMRPGLVRVKALLRRLGDPQRNMACVVVAGTNGKGSAATYLAALGSAAGLRTALYTSPHLLHPGERIVVDGRPLAESALVALIERCRPHIEAAQATFFEAMTAMALLHFREQDVQLAVLETGLGGRLDATNAVDARGVLLTSVGDDHHQILGDSLAQIAREKLGLARRGRPFYLGLLPAGIDALAAEVLAAAGAQAVDLSLGRGTVEAWDGRSARVRLWLPAGEAVVTLPQRGAMQAQMAALAWACWEDLARREGWPLGDAGRALRGVRAPCRYEGFGAAPELLLDTAHNTPALQQVLAQWSAERPRAERVLVFGVMRDKRIDAVLGEIAACAACVVLTAPCWERSLPPRDLAARLRAATPASGTPPLVLVVESVTAAMEEARRRAMAPTAGGRGQSVLVTGSNFLVAEVLDRIGVDDLVGPPHAPLWDAGSPLRERPQREQEVATP